MDRVEAYKQVENKIKLCTKCSLCKTAKNAVVGEGDLDAKIIFIGEAPGATEDETGRPFVGRAGQLLTKILEKIGYKREQVWIGNIIKHRPPENRDPLPAEIKACEAYLTEQIRIINPKLIITLGRFSMSYFYPDGKISRDRGHLIKCGRYYVYPVYHPAAALRSPTMMKDFVQDFIKIPQMLSEVEEKIKQERTKNSEVLDDGSQLGLKF